MLGPSPLTLGFLLLPARELLQLLHQLIDLIVGLLLFPSAHGLVLVLKLVELQLEQVCEILGRGLAAAVAALLLLLGDVYLVRLLGLLQIP